MHEICPIGFLSHPSEGNASDQSRAELAGDPWPSGRCLDQEKGFQGCFLPGITICQPKKTPCGGELTPSEQAENRRLSSIRIRLEQAIGGVKRDRMVKEKLRLLKDSVRDTVMETCCGLHNFR